MLDARDILAYLSDKKCYDKELCVTVIEDKRWGVFDIRICTEDGFKMKYELHHERLSGAANPLDHMEFIFSDFCNAYNNWKNN